MEVQNNTWVLLFTRKKKDPRVAWNFEFFPSKTKPWKNIICKDSGRLNLRRYMRENGLFYSETWGWIFILMGSFSDETFNRYDDSHVFYRLQLNELDKTFCLIFLAKSPYSDLIVCHKNEISSIFYT